MEGHYGRVCIEINKVQGREEEDRSAVEVLEGPPEVSQPILLEVQSVGVHVIAAKIMWDNGSSAALVSMRLKGVMAIG